MCAHMCVQQCGSQNLILSLHSVYSENWTQVVRFGGKLHFPTATSSQTLIFPVEEKKK